MNSALGFQVGDTQSSPREIFQEVDVMISRKIVRLEGMLIQTPSFL